MLYHDDSVVRRLRSNLQCPLETSTVIAPALATRLDAAVREVASGPDGSPAGQNALRAVGRDAEASGAGMTEVVSALLAAVSVAGGVKDVAPLLASLLGPFETARDGQ